MGVGVPLTEKVPRYGKVRQVLSARGPSYLPIPDDCPEKADYVFGEHGFICRRKISCAMCKRRKQREFETNGYRGIDV